VYPPKVAVSSTIPEELATKAEAPIAAVGCTTGVVPQNAHFSAAAVPIIVPVPAPNLISPAAISIA
jgi:hypothetical protein